MDTKFRRALLFAAALLFAVPVMAQNTGALLPALPPAFTNASGIAAVNGKLCSLKAGTTTNWQATYSDNALTVPLANPIALNAVGMVTTAIYLTPSASYKFILYAAGTGNSCNGTTVGAVIWTRDNIYDLAGLFSMSFATQIDDGTYHCSQFTGATGGAKLLAAYTALVAALGSAGGIVDCTGLTGAQTMTARFLIASPNITFKFGCSTWTLSGVTPSQGPPFISGNFQISANNVWLLGTPGCTVFKLAAAETSNMTSWGKSTAGTESAAGGGIRYIEGDGQKSLSTSIIDDTFTNFAAIVQGAAVTDNGVTVEYCNIHDFNHYGITTYNPNSSYNKFRFNSIHDNGKNDTYGTGDGIYPTYGGSYNQIVGNDIYSNLRSGIRFSAASNASVTPGVQTGNYVSGNQIHGNTLDAITSDEEANRGSINGSIEAALQIVNNTLYGNTQAGIHLATADSVGVVSNATISGNAIYSNSNFGIVVTAGAATSSVIETIITNNQVYSNTSGGISIGANVLDTFINNNIVIGNTVAQIADLGTRTHLPCNVMSIADGYCSTPSVTGINGVPIAANSSIIIASVALSTGAATVNLTGSGVFSAAGNYNCLLHDQTTPTNAVTITNVSGSQFTLAGTGTDTILYTCIGLK